MLLLVVALTGCKVTDVPSASPSVSTPSPAQTRTQGDTPPQPGATGFRVTDLTVRADPFQVTTTCPATITFSARISVAGGSGTVRYQWLRSDGSHGDPQTIRFDRVTKQDVVTTWTPKISSGTGYTGWHEVEILSPKHQVSERASFTLTCLGTPR